MHTCTCVLHDLHRWRECSICVHTESVSESSVDNGTKSSGKRTGEILRAVGAEEEGEEEEGMEVGVEASTLQQKGAGQLSKYEQHNTTSLSAKVCFV